MEIMSNKVPHHKVKGEEIILNSHLSFFGGKIYLFLVAHKLQAKGPILGASNKPIPKETCRGGS